MKLASMLTFLILPLAPARAQGSCGQVTIKGCCTGATLSFCQAGVLKQVDCTALPSCGWDAKLNYYACSTPGGSDPSGKHPKACPSVSDAGLPTPDAPLASDSASADLPPFPDTGGGSDSFALWDSSAGGDLPLTTDEGLSCDCKAAADGGRSSSARGPGMLLLLLLLTLALRRGGRS